MSATDKRAVQAVHALLRGNNAWTRPSSASKPKPSTAGTRKPARKNAASNGRSSAVIGKRKRPARRNTNADSRKSLRARLP